MAVPQPMASTLPAAGGQMSAQTQECNRNGTECHQVCLGTAAYCLQMGGRHAEAAHIRMLLDCAQICATSADFMTRGSDLHSRVCGVCAEVCERCAEDCERFGDDAQMRRCAEVCRRLASWLRRVRRRPASASRSRSATGSAVPSATWSTALPLTGARGGRYW